MSEYFDLVLGTAGHIDHGKSSLIQALTGVDPDRLIEEKRRGITIELGFAQLSLPSGRTISVVDVPGHERFVRQMISGATGIDLALICIAADDGIMPQTQEHLAVLELLGITQGVVALTKTDLVDEEWISFMTEEIRDYLSDTVFAKAPIVAVSSRTGAGLDELKEILDSTLATATRTKTGEALRLPVDRVFTIKGAGTVVTGTLWSGTATTGQEVEILPSGLRARIRNVQMHSETVECAPAGHRVALNLNGVSTDEINTGDFIGSVGSLTATDRFDADFTYLGAPEQPRPLKSGSRVHIAHGTRETTGRILFMGDNETLRPKEHALVQIRLDEPLPVQRQDRFVIRSYSPVTVIGGGSVLRAKPRRTTNISETTSQLLEALRCNDDKTAVEVAFALEELPVTAEQLAAATGIDQKICAQHLESMCAHGAAEKLSSMSANTAMFTSRSLLQKNVSALERALISFHSDNPTASGMSKNALRQRVLPKATSPQFEALLTYAANKNMLIVADGEVSHPKAGAGAQQALKAAAEQLFEAISAGGATPPDVTELLQLVSDTSLGHKALAHLAREQRIVRINDSIVFSAEQYARMQTAIRAKLNDGPANAATLKDAMGTSRKYAIPLFEYFDKTGVTRREGDMRRLA